MNALQSLMTTNDVSAVCGSNGFQMASLTKQLHIHARQRAHRTLNVIMPMRSSAIYARRHQGYLEVDSHGKPGQIDRLTFISIWPFII